MSGHFGSALIRGSCGASDMPLSILSGVLDRFHKAVVTASGQALPAGSGPVSGPLIDGDKSAVKGAMEGSLIKFTSDAIGYSTSSCIRNSCNRNLVLDFVEFLVHL